MARPARDLDVLFLGGDTTATERELAPPRPGARRTDAATCACSASYAGERIACQGSRSAPRSMRLLARAKVLVNIHRDARRPGYFEWLRMVEAMANGCVVLTEPSTGYEPLQPGSTSSRATTWPARWSPARRRRPPRAGRRRRPRRRSSPLAAGGDARPAPRRPQPRRARGGADRILAPEATAAEPDRGPPPAPGGVQAGGGRSASASLQAMLAEQALRRDIDAMRATVRFGSSDTIAERETLGIAAIRRQWWSGGERDRDAVQLCVRGGRDARVDRRVPRRRPGDRGRRRPLDGRQSRRRRRVPRRASPRADAAPRLRGQPGAAGGTQPGHRPGPRRQDHGDGRRQPRACGLPAPAGRRPRCRSRRSVRVLRRSRRSGRPPACGANSIGTSRGCARPTTSTPRRWSAGASSSATAAIWTTRAAMDGRIGTSGYG